LIVVLGGPRSSKSELAERLAADAALPVHHLRPRALATVQSGDAAIGERRDVTRLEEAGDSTVVIDDLEAFVRDHTGASDRVELVDMAIDALVRRDGLTVVVADDLDGAGDPPDVDRVWSELLARAMQRLTAAADRLLLAVAGRPVEVPSVREATPAESDELRNQTDVVVAAGTEDFANIVVDEGPPEWMQTVLRDALEQDVRRYPDEREAMAAIAARHGRSPEEVVLTNGAVDAFWLLAATFRPRHAACVGPTFSEP
jgi:adenosyl cobinamide kinase/adenosyl cobinamide phosphate guanylyltransferase